MRLVPTHFSFSYPNEKIFFLIKKKEIFIYTETSFFLSSTVKSTAIEKIVKK